MLFIVIVAVLVAFSYEPPADPRRITGTGIALGGTLLAITVIWLLAELFARWTSRRLQRFPDQRGPIMRSYQRLRWMHTTVLLGSYVGVIHGLDWPGVVRVSWGLERWVLIDDLLVLAPFLASLLLSWIAHFRVDEILRSQLETAEVRPPHWKSRLALLDSQLRHHLGVVLFPLLLLVTLQDLISLALPDGPNKSVAELAAGVGGMAMILVFAPLLLRFLWRAEPLPAGPLRERLERLGRRLGFRASDILVWNTKGAVINAAVAGILPRPRYVLLSDGLLEHMSEQEVEAVFGHEVGHIRHHHLWFFIAFLLGASLFLMVMTAATSRLLEQLVGQGASEHVLAMAEGLAFPLAGMGAYFGIFFGFLSRRFERQADIFGCRAVSCGQPDCPPYHLPPESPQHERPLCPVGIQIFVQTLERIAALNGSMRDTRSWRHFSIAKRVAFLEKLATRPDLEVRFQRMVLALKALVIAALMGAGWWIWCSSPSLARQVFELRF